MTALETLRIAELIASIRSTVALGDQKGQYAYAGENFGEYLRRAVSHCDEILALLAAHQLLTEPAPRKSWYVGSMNDGCFIIDKPPRPSHDDKNHDADVNCITGFPDASKATFKAAQAICDAHNAEPPLSGEPVAWQERQLRGPNEWSSWYGINKQPPRNYAAHNYQWRALYTREYP